MTNFIQGNPYFETGDWLVILAYLIGIIALGVWFGKGQKNTRDYFLGSKNIPWWGIGFSIVAAETSALTVIGVPGQAYRDDLGFIQMIIGYVIARIILAVVMVPHYFKGEIYSPYQLFENRLGPSARRTAGDGVLLGVEREHEVRRRERRAVVPEHVGPQSPGRVHRAVRVHYPGAGLD